MIFLREYKEALRQQRAQEGSSVYRSKEQMTPPGNEVVHNDDTIEANGGAAAASGRYIFNEESNPKRPVQKVHPSRVNYQNSNVTNGANNELKNKNARCTEQTYQKLSSPIKASCGVSTGISTNTTHVTKVTKTPVNFIEGMSNLILNALLIEICCLKSTFKL